MTGARLKRNIPLLKALTKASPRKRKDILRGCSNDLLHSLSEIALNLLKGNIPLSSQQYAALKRQKNKIRLLADRKISLRRKRRTLQQTGGFLLPLLATAIPVIGQLLGGLRR